MPDLPGPHVADAPLLDLKVLELAGELGGYAGRLLADLGAEVTRIRPAGPEPGRTEEASLVVHPEGCGADGVDVEAWFLHRGKREVALDPDSDGGRRELEALVASADVVIQSGGADARSCPALDPEAVQALNPGVVQVVLTPFGLGGPAAKYVSADLVRLAAGGLLWLGGYPDAEPVAPFGHQSTQATAIFGAVAALLGLIERDRTGEGRSLEVSSQEAIVQALETSLADFELTGSLRSRRGAVPPEAGTGVYRCADGYVSMVAGRLGTAQAWTHLREWLVEAGAPGAAQLWDEGWDDLSFRRRPEAIALFEEVFGSFALDRGKQELYLEAQRRSIALAPVNDLDEVLADEQLLARGFFVAVRDEETGAEGLVPSPPYRLSPLGPAAAAVVDALVPTSAVAPRSE